MQKLSLFLHIETVRKSLLIVYIPKKNVYKNFAGLIAILDWQLLYT